MTLPTTTILPIHSAKIQEGGLGLESYIKELIFTLQRQYEEVAQAVNGDIRRDVDSGSFQYLPAISGSTLAGEGTYTNNHQVGIVLRQGLLVDVWFDVRWTAHTGTGTMQLDLPYEVSDSLQGPFIAVISAENITFTDYLTGTAVPGTRSLQIQDNVSAAGVSDIAITNADTTLKGHVRYVGKSIERS